MTSRTLRVALTAAAGVAFAAVSQAGLTWYRYGRHDSRDARGGALDTCLPSYDVAERHAALVRAPADVTYAAALDLRLDRSPLVRVIFGARERLLGAKAPQDDVRSLTIADLTKLGWRVVVETSGREIAFAAVTKPWEANPRFVGLALEEFRRFDEPGYVKIAWSIAAEPVTADTSRVVTATRAATTDPEARRRFRLYWAVFSPGIKLIRREMVRLVRADAEARARDQSRK